MGFDERRRRIAWVEWKRTSFSKKEGGLCFKDIEKFNNTLLAKQAWIILKTPDCLFVRVLQSRYFPDCDIQDGYFPDCDIQDAQLGR